jgi:hypothetical protein
MTYKAHAGQQHNGRCEGVVLPSDQALRLGERCRYPKVEVGGITIHSPLKWHVAITNPGCERRVREQMQDLGIDTILPMIRYWQIRNKQRDVVERPLVARTVIFGIDPKTQMLLQPVYEHEWVGKQYVPTGRIEGYKSLVGLERIARCDGERWAEMPAEQAFNLRFQILRGEFDATQRQVNPAMALPPMIKWLLERGEIPSEGVLTHKEAKRKGLNFSVAA